MLPSSITHPGDTFIVDLYIGTDISLLHYQTRIETTECKNKWIIKYGVSGFNTTTQCHQNIKQKANKHANKQIHKTNQANKIHAHAQDTKYTYKVRRKWLN